MGYNQEMTSPTSAADPADDATAGQATQPVSHRRIRAEILIVLGLSLGQSAIYALVAIAARLTAETSLGNQSTSINTSQSPRPWLDLTYQLLALGFALVPVALALYFLASSGRHPFRSIGFDFKSPWRDLGYGFTLAAAIGIPGLGLYAAGRALGITVEIQTTTLNALWWTVPVLLLAAVKNAVLEEIIVVGYLSERLEDLQWGRLRIIVVTALLRGSYHLYQGIGPFIGNVVMGIVFSLFYFSRWGRRRVMPLVVAHTILDVVSFVGYYLLPSSWLEAMGVG